MTVAYLASRTSCSEDEPGCSDLSKAAHFQFTRVSDINDAFRAMQSDDVARSVLTFDESRQVVVPGWHRRG
jgi:hypothetical protein